LEEMIIIQQSAECCYTATKANHELDVSVSNEPVPDQQKDHQSDEGRMRSFPKKSQFYRFNAMYD
jgi:hypothetical protein